LEVRGATVSWTGRTAHGVRIVQVYTPERFRHQGYASAAVAGLSAMLLDAGRRFCFLYTDDGTPHLAALYAAIGYEEACSCQEWDFTSATSLSE
jgi:predicted GNAT family acetyltransferase